MIGISLSRLSLKCGFKKEEVLTQVKIYMKFFFRVIENRANPAVSTGVLVVKSIYSVMD